MKVLAWIAFFGLVIAALARKLSVTRINIIRNGSIGHFDERGAEIMVSCSRCGIFLPSSEAIQHEGKVYCSQEHVGPPANVR
ncbi:MAG: hypothetical protein C4516_01145 [Oxalobacter sp.]|nr:MAG: hypothetical protein C4516_01145 [Oxalobacter sp.]